ncbi:hypothetical protein [Calothrix sp. PCC 6303]|uniref:hypothetical protein n=1 Tax=Calothrix sp. PCC 6303 TaxID=1170562 RepID=UPI0002ED2481|nr:hypothetical protein [Calothrix sp. PCC 6303]
MLGTPKRSRQVVASVSSKLTQSLNPTYKAFYSVDIGVSLRKTSTSDASTGGTPATQGLPNLQSYKAVH